LLTSPQQIIEQAIKSRKVNFDDCAHPPIFFMTAIYSRYKQQFQRCDRQRYPGTAFAPQQSKSDPTNQTREVEHHFKGLVMFELAWVSKSQPLSRPSGGINI
jgi:hypothetical protein